MKHLTRRRFPVPVFAPRRLGWWLLVLSSIGGLAVFALAIADSIPVFPYAFVTALVLSVPLVGAWMLLLRIPQLWARISTSGAVAAMLWGGGAAVGLYALPANGAILELLAQYRGVEFASTWGAAIAAPLTEETAKAFAVGLVVLASGQRLRTPMDAALIAGYSAVGFTATEDILYSLNVAWLNLGEGPVVSTLVIYLVRAVIFGLVAHVVFSALVGAGIGWISLGKGLGLGAARIPAGLAMIGAGYGLHWLWNSPILVELWARFAYVFAVPFLMWWLLYAVRKLEHAWFERTLAEPGVMRGLDPALPGIVKRSWFARHRYRGDVAKAWGWQAREYQIQAEALLTDLADAASAGDQRAVERFRGELILRSHPVDAGTDDATRAT